MAERTKRSLKVTHRNWVAEFDKFQEQSDTEEAARVMKQKIQIDGICRLGREAAGRKPRSIYPIELERGRLIAKKGVNKEANMPRRWWFRLIKSTN
jgi:hypothetical protein